MKEITCKSYNKFSLKPSPIISEITNKIGSINLLILNIIMWDKIYIIKWKIYS